METTRTATATTSTKALSNTTSKTEPQSPASQSLQSPHAAVPLSLLERRTSRSGCNGSPGITFVNKRIELTRELSWPSARAPLTPYPAQVPLTPSSMCGTPTVEQHQGILDSAGAALKDSTEAAVMSASPPASNHDSDAAAAATNGPSSELPRRTRSSAHFGWMSDWRRLAGVASVAVVMLAMIITQVRFNE